jgi:hypothetical protein
MPFCVIEPFLIYFDKYLWNATIVIVIILLIYILLWVLSVGAMIGVTGGAPTSIGGALHTITGGMINLQ